MLFGIETSLELAAAIEFTVSPIIVEAAALGDIIGMLIVDKVLDLFALLLFVFGFVLVFNLGFDIEESSAVVLAAFAAVALGSVSRCVNSEIIDQ